MLSKLLIIVVVMMRGRGDKLVFALAKGAILQTKYSFLQCNGKIVQHLYFKDIEESLILN